MPAPDVIETLATRFSGEASALGVSVPRERLLETARALKDAHGYRYYVCASATDREDVFEVVHGARNLETGDTIWIGTSADKSSPEVESLAFVYSGAEWHERELFDLFGIVFRNHPDLRRILMPDEYEGYPLRKEFPIDAPWGYRPATSDEPDGSDGATK